MKAHEILRNSYNSNGESVRISSGIGGMKDGAGRQELNAIFGQRIVAEEVTSFGSTFCYPPDLRKAEIETNGDGSVAITESMLVLDSGTADDSYAIQTSKRSLIYLAGKDGYAKFTSMFSDGIENNRRMSGLIDDENGFAVGYEGLNLAVFRKRDGVLVDKILQRDWNLDKLDGTGKSKFVYNPQKLNVFRIDFGYLGGAPIIYEIYAGIKNGWLPFHVIDYPNNYEEVSITLPYLKLRASNENFGVVSSNSTIKIGSVECGVLSVANAPTVSSRDFTVPGSYTYGTTEDFFIIFHVKPTYGTLPNKIESILNLLSFGVEGNKPVLLKRYILDTPPTGGTWIDVSPYSMMEYNTTFTTPVSLTNAELTLPIALDKTGKIFETTKIIDLEKRMLPDYYVAYSITSTVGGDLVYGIGWKELF